MNISTLSHSSFLIHSRTIRFLLFRKKVHLIQPVSPALRVQSLILNHKSSIPSSPIRSAENAQKVTLIPLPQGTSPSPFPLSLILFLHSFLLSFSKKRNLSPQGMPPSILNQHSIILTFPFPLSLIPFFHSFLFRFFPITNTECPILNSNEKFLLHHSSFSLPLL